MTDELAVNATLPAVRCVCCGEDASDGDDRSDGWYCADCLTGGWDTRGL